VLGIVPTFLDVTASFFDGNMLATLP